MSNHAYEDFTIFSQLADGRLTSEELEQVEARLMNDAEFRRRYIKFMDLDFELEQRLGANSSLNKMPDNQPNPILLTASTTKPLPYKRPETTKTSHSSFGSFLIKFAAVLVMALGGVWFYTFYNSTPETPIAVERELQAVKALVWSVNNAGSKWKQGDILEEGEYHLPSGSAELRLARVYTSSGDKNHGLDESFPTAVRLTVEGPTRFTLRSADYVQLLSGKLAAEVLPDAKGFTISTNEIEVVDLGTRFAVTANTTGDAAVHVYDGIVEAAIKESNNKSNTLETGNTVRLNPDSEQLAAIPFQEKLFAPRPTWNGLLEEASPTVRVLNRPPRSAKRSIKESSKESFIFRERDELSLSHDVIVNLSEPKRVMAKAVTKGDFVTTIPAGTKVSTYLANFALEDGAREGIATFHFDSPILGVIYHHDLILATDRKLGAPQTDYSLNEKPTKAGAAALTGLDGGSRVEIHENRRSLSISFKRFVGNQVRILVAKD